jgi:HEAT repeat protein
MDRIDENTQQLMDALALAARKLPAGRDNAVSLLSLLGCTQEPRAALAALTVIWPGSDSWSTATRHAIGTWFDVRGMSDVTAAAHAAIARLLSSMPAEAVPDLDEAVRRLGHEAWRIGHFLQGSWTWVAPPSPDQIGEGPARIQLLGLLASHADGHVREAAVAALAASADPAALPFLLWRCGDWVQPVRSRAERAVRAQMRVELAPVFARLLPLVARLELIRRVDTSALIADIGALLLQEPEQASLTASLRSGSRFVRREACRVLDRLDLASRPDILELALGSDDPVVRSWLLSWEERLRPSAPAIAAGLRKRLVSDPLSRIRLRALEAMLAGGDDWAGDRLHEALLDTSPTIRHLARFHLGKRDPAMDFAAWYRTALSQGGGRTVSAVAGLGETGVPGDCNVVLSFLSRPARQARAALKAAAYLDADGCHDALLATLTDRRDGVCRQALALLELRLPEPDAATLQRLWPQAQTPVSRRAMAEAMLRLPPWPALIALLDAARTDPDAHQGAAAEALARWQPEHRATYAPVPPPAPVRDRAKSALREAKAALPADIVDRIERVLAALTP